MKEKIVFCWSGGKDSALALHRLLLEGRCEVVSLLTTCNEHFQRVSMHGVRVDLLEQQARAIGIPLRKMFVSQRSSNDEYLDKSQLYVRCLARAAPKGFGIAICCLLREAKFSSYGSRSPDDLQAHEAVVCADFALPFDARLPN